MPTEKKRNVVAQLSEDFARSNLVILTNYRGLKMKELTAVRRALERAGIGYHVAKNTLLRRALGDSADTLAPYIEGPIAVAFAFEDIVAAAKALDEQAKAFPAIKIKGGLLEGQAVSPAGLKALATLPPRPVLLGQLVGMIQAPAANLLSVLTANMRQLLYVLQQRSEQGAESAPATEAA